MFAPFSSLYLRIQERYPNIYIIIISILVTIWFQGMTRIIQHIFPDKNIYYNLLLMIVPAFILYVGDGRLDEIYNFENLALRVSTMSHVKDTQNSDRRR